jgi:hypothetical protein
MHTETVRHQQRSITVLPFHTPSRELVLSGAPINMMLVVTLAHRFGSIGRNDAFLRTRERDSDVDDGESR